MDSRKLFLLLIAIVLSVTVCALQINDIKSKLEGMGRKSNILCPSGFYCPEGTRDVIPCPAGTYSSTPGATSKDTCHACPANTYSPTSGSISCKPCGTHSSSSPGSRVCKCKATNRMFHVSDGSCRCRSGYKLTKHAPTVISSSDKKGVVQRGVEALRSMAGYEDPVDNTSIVNISDEDVSTYDCVPIRRHKCAHNEVFDINGNCVSVDGTHCHKVCGTSEHVAFDTKLGICQCPQKATSKCDANCRKNIPHVVLVNNNEDLSLHITFADKKTFVIPTDKISMYSDIDCQPITSKQYKAGVSATCTVQFASTGSGIHAPYGLPSIIADKLVELYPEAESYVAALPKNVSVSPSVFCSAQGSSIFFEMAPRDLSFPVYASNAIINTNPTYDYAPFSNLPKLFGVSVTVDGEMVGYKKSQLPHKFLYAHTFMVPGTYTFRDTQGGVESVVHIMPYGVRCPVSLDGIDELDTSVISTTAHTQASTLAFTKSIAPLNTATLSAIGVQASGFVQSPNWGIVGILVLVFVGIFALACIFVLCIQKSKLKSQETFVPTYRKDAIDDNLDVWTFSTKGSVLNIENRSNGQQRLELDDEDLLLEALERKSKRVNADILNGLKLKYKHTPHNPQLTEDERRVMNELLDNADFEDCDFNTLYKVIEDTNRHMRSYFSKQHDLLHNFYTKTEADIEHLKTLLSIKMQVQMQRTGEGFSEAVDKLTSGELLARQAFTDLDEGRESHLKMLMEEIRARIASITLDCNIFPIMQLLKELHSLVQQSQQRLLQERVRRKTFAAHVEIVGKDIVEILLKQDKYEVEAQDDYWHALLYFDSQVQEVRRTMHARESTHLIEMESLTNDDDRKIEQMQYHRAMVELVRVIQVELMNLEERLNAGIMNNIVTVREQSFDIWVFVHSYMLPKRLDQLRSSTEGRIFRGINPDLAKVLTGAMGMLRSGIEVNPKTGCYVPKAPFDPADPFATITDPGDVYREWYEKQLSQAIEQIRQEAEEFRQEQEDAELERIRREEEEREMEQRRLAEELERERQAIREANVDVTVDTVLKDIVDDTEVEGVRAVADDLRRDQKELLAVFQKKRADIESNEDINDQEKAKLLAIWDDKIQMMEDMLKDEALGLISYLQSQEKEEEPSAPEDPSLGEPSLRELELMSELERTRAELDAFQATLYTVPDEVEDEISAAEKLLMKKQKELVSFENANADKLRELDEILGQRQHTRLMGEMGDLADDDLDALGLDEELRALELARRAHKEELANAREKLMKKRQDVQDRQEAKKRAIEEAQRREAALRKELMEQDDIEDLDDDEEDTPGVDTIAERRKRFEENQRLRREAELARLEEEQRRAIAAATDSAEVKRLMKEFESNKLALLKKLNQEEIGQKAKLDEALKKRQEARMRKLREQQEDPIVKMERKKKAMDLILSKEVSPTDLTETEKDELEKAREIIFEDDEVDEAELNRLSEEQRALFEAQKAKFAMEKEARIQARKEARRKRIEAEQKKEAEREKARELERLQRIHHDMELDLIEESLLQELEAETRAVVDEALGVAGIEVYNVFAAEARKKHVEKKIERVKQELEDAKEANEARNVEEAQKLLEQAAKEREMLEEQMAIERGRQAKNLQDKLALRKSQNAAKIKEERERRRREEAKKLEFAQKNAELTAQLQTIKALVERLPDADREQEAKRIIEAQLHDAQNKEKVQLLANQSAERKLFWKEKMLENDDLVLDEVQKLAAEKFDEEHDRQLRELEQNQLDEIKYFYGQLYPNTDFSTPEWSIDHGKRVLQELAKKKQAMLEEEKQRKEEEYQRRKKELEEKERLLEEENRKKLEELQSKKAAEDAAYQKMLSEHDDKLLKNHKMLLARKQQAMEAELQGANVNTDMRERLVAQQKEEMARYEAALKEEYQRQRQAMVKRLQLRRQLQEQRKNNEERKRRLEERKKKSMEERMKAREELEKLKAQESQKSEPTVVDKSTTGGNTAATTAASTSGASQDASTAAIGRRRGGANAVTGTTSTTTSASDPMSPGTLLRQEEVSQKAKLIELQAQKDEEEKKMREEIAEKMDNLRKLLVELDQKKREEKEKAVYMDEKDKLIKPLRPANFDPSLGIAAEIKLQPEPKSIASMSPREFVLYRFIVNLTKLFAEQGIFEIPVHRRRAQGNIGNVPSILIASALPPSPYPNIAFPNSYYYDPVDNRLWIRTERLSDPGECILVLLHALAHISSSTDGETFHDHDVAFTKHFYAYLRIVCSDMYFNRSSRALTAINEQAISPLYSTPPSQVAVVSAAPAASEEEKSDAPVAIDDIELFDSEENVSLLPNKFIPRIPKLDKFELASIDLTSKDACDIVDDLIDIHVSSSDSNEDIYNTSASARKTLGVVLSSSHGMSYFNTSQMMQRLSQYDAFASSTRLRQFLINVEKKQAGYESTREKLGRDRYQNQDGTVDRANARNNEDRLAHETDDVLPVPVMQDVCDELNRQFISVLDQCFESSTKLQQLEKKSTESGLTLRQRTQISEAIESERIILARLDREKAVLLQRIKRLENKDIPNRAAQKASDFNPSAVTKVLEVEKKRAQEANEDALELELDL